MSKEVLTAEVVVLGVGSMGAAACLALAKRGVSVLGLDAASIPNDRSSHHGATRMIRLAYHEHVDYVELLKEAWQGWRALEKESGQSLLSRTGGLYLGSAQGELLQGTLQAARRHDLPHRQLDADALSSEFPWFHAPPGCSAVFEEQAGFLYSEEAIRCFARLARDLGAQLLEHRRVSSVAFEDGGVSLVDTEGRRYRARHLVLSAGPGSVDLDLELAPLALEVTRQELGWFEVPHARKEEALALPCWALEAACTDHPSTGLFYGFPALEEDPLLKAALHLAGPAADPSLPLHSDAAALEPVTATLASLLPGICGPLSRSAVCRYTNTRDGHFVIDTHPDLPHTSIACGFSGHGFKFAPVVGEILADLCLDGGTTHPIGFLSWKRFTKA